MLQTKSIETIESYIAKTPGKNHWVSTQVDGPWTPDPVWDPTMPTYQSLTKAEAIGRYWDNYYAEAERLATAFGERFRIFDMKSTINTERGVHDLLDFVGVPDANRTSSARFHENRTHLADSELE